MNQISQEVANWLIGFGVIWLVGMVWCARTFRRDKQELDQLEGE